MSLSVLKLVAGVLGALIIFNLITRMTRIFARRIFQSPPSPSFDMAELHAMLNRGLITPEEFERLKALSMIQPAQAAAEPVQIHGFEVLPPAPPKSPDNQ